MTAIPKVPIGGGGGGNLTATYILKDTVGDTGLTSAIYLSALGGPALLGFLADGTPFADTTIYIQGYPLNPTSVTFAQAPNNLATDAAFYYTQGLQTLTVPFVLTTTVSSAANLYITGLGDTVIQPAGSLLIQPTVATRLVGQPDGFVITTGGNGTLGVDTNTYISAGGGLTAPDVLYATGPSTIGQDGAFQYNDVTFTLSITKIAINDTMYSASSGYLNLWADPANATTGLSIGPSYIFSQGSIAPAMTGTYTLGYATFVWNEIWGVTHFAGTVTGYGGGGVLTLQNNNAVVSTYVNLTATSIDALTNHFTISTLGRFDWSANTGVNTGGLLTLGINGTFGSGAAAKINTEDTYISVGTGGNTVFTGLWVTSSYPQYSSVVSDMGYFGPSIVGYNAQAFSDLIVVAGGSNILYLGYGGDAGPGTATSHTNVITIDGTVSGVCGIFTDTVNISATSLLNIGAGATGSITIDPGAAPVVLGGTTSTLGFYGTSPSAKGAVTGLKAGNAALGSLLTLLAAYGLITDSSGP